MYSPTPWFWNFVGGAAVIMSFGFSYSIIRGSNFKVEAANHKLEINSAVERVKKEISDTLSAESVEHLPTTEKLELENRLGKAAEVLIETQENILTEDEEDNLKDS